ncbi:MAG: HAMP domain-containing protein, partial [Candidatus Riflebacteria bacterium]|nr:HAMP domain-containing protein [Candidatus Riflebacteria bacterium]
GGGGGRGGAAAPGITTGLDRAVSLVVALLLSLVPGLLLQWDWGGGGVAAGRARADAAWLAETSTVAAALRKASTFSAWVGIGGRALAACAESLATHPRRGGTPDRVFAQARERASLRGLPRGRLWAFVRDPAAPGGIRLCRGAGLESEMRSFWCGLGAELIRVEEEGLAGLDEARWGRRCRGLFGEVVPVDLFGPAYQGVPFPVIFQGKPQYLVWRLISAPSGEAPPKSRGGPGRRSRSGGRGGSGAAGRVVGGFIWLVPTPPDPAPLVARLCLAHWSLLRAGQEVWPALVPLPVGGPPGRLLIHSRVRSRAVQKALTRLAKDTPMARPAGTDLGMGQIFLPGRSVGGVVGWPGFRACLTPLADGMPWFAALISHRPPDRVPLARRLAVWWLVLAILGWAGVGLVRGSTGRWPALPIRHSLVLWFLGLVSIPVALSCKAGLVYLDDLADNLQEAERQNAVRLLQEIEAGTGRLLEMHRQACRSLVTWPGFCSRLQDIQTAGQPEGPLLGELVGRLCGQGVEPTAILLFGHGGWSLATFSASLGESSRRSLPLAIDPFARQVLAGLEGSRSVARRVTALLQDLHRRRPETKRFIRPPTPLPGMTESETNVQYLRRHGNEIQSLTLGPRQVTFFYDILPDPHRPWFATFILWNHDLAYRRYLEAEVPAAFLRYRREHGVTLDLAAFQRRATRWEQVRSAGDPRGLEAWAEAGEEREVLGIRGGHLVLARPLPRMPGFILVARVPLTAVWERLAAERGLWGMIMVSLLALAGVGGMGLSRWLASPVVRMTRHLQRVAAGDLAVEVAEPRADELGTASDTLATMVTWLRERERLLPFVSPKALEVVGAGNVFTAGAGSVQTVAMLVSDIRSFTTLAETRSPDEVFRILNGHLGAMAAEIQARGGTVDRFVGDAVWAVFFAEAGRSPAAAAVATARAMMRRHAALNEERRAAGGFPFTIGVGLEVGEVVAGVLGDPGSRLDFTVIGEPVGAAGRWEAASRHGTRTRIVASSRFVAALEAPARPAWRPLAGPDELYELDTLDDQDQSGDRGGRHD